MNNELINTFVRNYGPIITLIVVVTVSLISILRLGIKFDINQFLSMRKRHHLALARNCCPHMRFTVTENDIKIQSLFYSPSGTLNWVCRQCGATVAIAPDNEEMQEMATYFINNPKEYRKRMSRYQRHMKKAL